MIKANSIKKGNIVDIGGQPHQVKDIDVQTPSARGSNTLYKVRFINVVTGQKLDQTYKGNDTLEELEMERRPVSFIYRNQNLFTFMDSENFEQYTLGAASLEGRMEWLVEGMEEITALLLDGRIMAIDLPAAVDLEIVETAPALKGASATNRNKPATLANGITVLVPEYLTPGETIRVNTETGKFMSRVKS
ncbi:elongation factor P-like protein YeiP [Desulfococcus sp.]|uniref:elongation factor P-like protein EfpL n=1 Tax=Desulfococcus sp. TaxID=2025834 RepID=UPI0035945434